MANAQSTVPATRRDITRILSLIEEAQALAASRAQLVTALGGAAAVKGDYDFSQSDITLDQFMNALNTLETLFPTILGDHATNLYSLKLE